MFGIFYLCMSVFALLFIKETKGRTLEDMDVLFGAVSAEQRAQDVERSMAIENKKTELEEREVIDDTK